MFFTPDLHVSITFWYMTWLRMLEKPNYAMTPFTIIVYLFPNIKLAV